MPVEIKMIAGAFLTIGITGTVIGLVNGTIVEVGMFLVMSVVATIIIAKRQMIVRMQEIPTSEGIIYIPIKRKGECNGKDSRRLGY